MGGTRRRMRDEQESGTAAAPVSDAIAAAVDEARREAFITLVRSLPLRVFMTDREMRILAVSRLTCEDKGVSEADCLGRTLFEIDPVYFEPYRAAYERCLAGEGISAPRV